MAQGPVLRVGGSSVDPLCPKCGKAMLPTTGGNFCPGCGTTDRQLKPYTDTATPRLGRPAVSMETMALAGKSLLAADLKLAPVNEPPPRHLTPVPAPGARPIIVQKAPTPAQRREAPKAPPPPAPASEPISIPRCRFCGNPLDVDEMAEGVCRRCGVQRPAPSVEPERSIKTGELVTGLACLLATLWAATLVLVRVVKSNPDTWQAVQFVEAGARAGLVVLALAASAAWIGGRRWAAGVAMGLGPLAAVLTGAGLLTGAFIGDLMVASAWMLAGIAGTAAALAAVLPTSAFGQEDGGAGPGGKARSVVGAVSAFAAAGVCLWLAVVSAAGRTMTSEGALALVLAITGCAAAIAAGILLIARPPRSRTHLAALFAAVLAACLPALALLVSRLLPEPGGPIAPVAGLGAVVGLPALAGMAAGEVATEIAVVYGLGIIAALVLAIVVFARRHGVRGSTLAGFSLAWAAVWIAGFVRSLA